MKSRFAAAIAVGTVLLAPAAAQAETTKVTVRVEGAEETLFEGRVNTDGHTIDGQVCDGTNGGANPSPVAVHTAALDDASKKGGFEWTRSYNPDFSDFLVNSIFDETPATGFFWSAYTNGAFNQVGGCQQKVEAGDEVLYAVANGNEKGVLQLTGPKTATVGKNFKLKVLNGLDKKPFAGVKLGKVKVPANGVLKVKATKKGKFVFKAEAPDAIRSNAVVVSVKAAKKKK